MSDKTAKLTSAFLAGKGKTVMLTEKLYNIEGKVEVNLDGADVEISSRFGSKILLSNRNSISSYQTPEGNIHLKNAGNVIISGICLEGVNQSEGSYILPLLAEGLSGSSLCNLLIENCKSVLIDGCTITNGVYAGVRILDCERVTITNSNIDWNTYAGALLHRVGQVYVTGNSFSYNGYGTSVYMPLGGSYWGYGISISHRYGTGVDTEGIYIAGNKCFYNTRKGIDFHGGIGVKVIGNHIKGFGNSAIGGVNESGSDPGWIPPPDAPIDPLWAKHIKDVFIVNNLIENDIPWCNSLTNPGQTTDIISIGSYADTPLGAGSIFVEGNILNNCNALYQRAPIFCFVNIGGEATQAVAIKNNILSDVVVVTTPFGYPLTQDGVIYVNNGTVVPKFIDISGNIISGSSTNCIKVACYNSGELQENLININNNSMSGRFTYPIFIDRDLNHQKTLNNIYNDENLPDMTDAFNGSLRAVIPSSSDLSVNFTVNTSSNICTATGSHGLKPNQAVQLTTSGILPNPLTVSVTYYVHYIDENSFQLALIPGGTIIDFTSSGSGTHAVIKGTRDLLSINANGFTDGAALFDIKIIAVGAYPKFLAIYNLSAFAKNDGGVTAFGTNLREEEWILGEPNDTFRPSLNWIGSGDVRILRVTCPTTFTNYNIEVKISSWRLQLFRTE